MKSLITFAIVMLGVLQLQAQKEDIKTYSVSLNEFISFVAERYEAQEFDEENDIDRQITFLVQVPNQEMEMEEKLMLKQGFKLLSERLNDYNTISILSYFGYNGVVLDNVAPSERDKVFYVLNDMKGNISEFHEDGIELAYRFAKQNFNEEAANSIVIIRNNKPAKSDLVAMTNKEMKKLERKKKKKEILKVAVSILPEIIALLKN